ncbi:related to SUR4 - elongase, involved in fatty acid and sphingolipid biosynthesis [Melanopsichium pennsylvanicum]|uniref:Elongation of fatty acids protein n=2 Tax=Melanopsichium pennsylvanicum TaxID=63383 RepID=A0AAJ4XFK5_9BASI|nr:likely fatty acid elongase [Melanopsichium pennsylvanicum 4]SNX81469.1 related to SUR4 - elongase, involved in fatty acid and sphingolipid biosynthesis [Melanopsichium pennsylvanicum]
MLYPLDNPRLSILQRLADQPYPAKPQGLPVADWAFELSLSPYVPLLTGLLYLLATHATNHRFGPGKPKPTDLVKQSYGLSQTVLGHNILLAAYSGWTFFHAATRIFAYLFRGAASGGISGFTNAYCTVPIADASFAGLGIYVWLFYISKYYEIIDSVILILKGKPVSNLQSYHHAGAILCMWAAYRYSAPAVFIFLLFNSLVHTLMYTYYSMTAMKLPFTGGLKRSMTKIQITQLVVGCGMATSYGFLTYNPSAYPTGVVPIPGRHIINPISAAYSSFDSVNNVTTSGSLIASNTKEAVEFIKHKILSTVDVNARTPCVSTTGQSFAVALNVAYLVPLIYLFVSFYIRSYQKKHAKTSKSQ